ncbi:MAG: hypothetical protein ACQCN3_00515 [Candidatus Bathyarchaeia archaeon]|jgi:hypothetical protein
METTAKTILNSLLNKHIIGEKHTNEDNAVKCLPKHLRGDGKKALKKLLKDGLVVGKRTEYGFEVSLNPRRLQEIIELTKP